MDQPNARPTRLAKRVDEYVGERIRQRRTLLGLTQDQLASALDISYQQVQKYETGANRVSAGRLYEIAKHLDVEIGYFFDGLEPGKSASPMPHGGRNRVMIELVRNFGEIQDPTVRNAVSSLVKSLSATINGADTQEAQDPGGLMALSGASQPNGLPNGSQGDDRLG